MKKLFKPIKTALLMVGIGYASVKLYETTDRLYRNAKTKMRREANTWELEFEDKDSVRDFIDKLNSIVEEYEVFYIDREACFGWDRYDVRNIKVVSNGSRWIVRISKPKYHK